MSKFIDLTGQRSGRLMAIERAKNSHDGRTMWLCRCECNKIIIVRADHLNGSTKSCGCLHQPHGHHKRNKTSATYWTWSNMLQRCTNPNVHNYKNYGGRGICVCKAWLSFKSFLRDMGEKPPNLMIDRIDNDGDYCKENCRWSTLKEQARNKTTNILITIDGVTKCLAEWCKIYKICYANALYRIHHRWPPEEVLELVPRKKRKTNV